MSVVAPPPVHPPGQDELEALIREARARARQRRRRLAAAALVAVAAGAGLAASSILGGGVAGPRNERGPRPFTSLPRCRSDQLRLSLVGGGVAGGSYGSSFRFRNTSGELCTLRGWPTFRFEMRSGNRVTPRPHKIRTFGAYSVRHPPRIPRVVLRPGATVTWGFNAFDGTGLNRLCPSSRRILVVPPGTNATLAVTARLPYCGRRFFWVLPVGGK